MPLELYTSFKPGHATHHCAGSSKDYRSSTGKHMVVQVGLMVRNAEWQKSKYNNSASKWPLI